MSDAIDPNWLPDEPVEDADENPGEVPTSFATKGLGRSGREGDIDGDPLE